VRVGNRAGDDGVSAEHCQSPQSAFQNTQMNIGEASRITGLSRRSIRHYEASGIIGQAQRESSGYRSYGPDDIRTLRFVRNARRLGFELKEIASLVRHWRTGPQDDADIMASWWSRNSLAMKKAPLPAPATRVLLA
jgi:DNA-binding transcriptional MerR regulator